MSGGKVRRVEESSGRARRRRRAAQSAAEHRLSSLARCAEIVKFVIITVVSSSSALGWIRIVSSVQVTGKTGVEMEALTAVSVAALSIYDMCKAIDRDIEITGIRLTEKSGGRSGHYKRSDQEES